jgi:mycothiol synthase
VDDADTLADLINEVNIAEVGFPLTDADEVRGDLTAPERDPEGDVVLVDPDGTIAAYLTISMDTHGAESTANSLAWVRPALWGHGLSRWLLEWSERGIERERRRAAHGRIVIRLACWSANAAAERLFEALGYVPVRTFMQMRIELGAPTPVEIPPGIEIRSFRMTDAPTAYAALAEAFDDHWGRAFDPFERWVHHHIEGPGASFDPSLWFVALDGSDVVGVITTRPDLQSAADTASVDALGVRRAWRGRGIGRALLLTTFAAVRDRGIGAIQLGVDASNPTGARRLYEGVGMHMVRSFEFWEKALVG